MISELPRPQGGAFCGILIDINKARKIDIELANDAIAVAVNEISVIFRMDIIILKHSFYI